MFEIPSVLKPLSINRLTLRNRVVMAPMTREQAPGGTPTKSMANYYARRARHGVGLIITEGTPPDPAGAFSDRVPRFYGADALDGWCSIVDAVHVQNGKIFAQLWHVGAFDPSLISMQTDSMNAAMRIGPSGLAGPNTPCGGSMSQGDIDTTIENFGNAAKTAMALGFDGIEIHAAHGYLPDQFLWSETNLRNDDYGGSLFNRVRFSAEIVKECRHRCGADFPISFRFSQWKQLDYNAQIANRPADLEAILLPLTEAGVSLFHASTRRFWDPAFDGSDLTLAAWTKKLTGRPVIAVGSVTLSNDFKSSEGKVSSAVDMEQIDLINECIDRGDFDLIAIGRALLANPDWVEIVSEDRLDDLQAFDRRALEALI